MTHDGLHKLVVAHQLDPAVVARAVAPHVPAFVEFRALSADAAWEVPADAEVFVTGAAGFRSIPTDPPRGWPHALKWVQLETTGIDRMPAWLFSGPPVTCGRGTNAIPIAEFVLAAMLAFEKRIPDVWVSRAADWQVTPLGGLAGKTLGLVGLGTLAQAVAVRARGFGMRMLATRRTSAPSPLADVATADLATVAREADHLVITAPLTEKTNHLIGRDVLARVKPSAHIINVSRGGLIDQDALLDALDTQRLARATLDVTTPEPLPEGHPLYSHPRVRLSPHNSWSSPAYGFLPFVVENLRRYIAGEELNGQAFYERGY
jgi:phosphoglycerate dehydrogenase-like enzyme